MNDIAKAVMARARAIDRKQFASRRTWLAALAGAAYFALGFWAMLVYGVGKPGDGSVPLERGYLVELMVTYTIILAAAPAAAHTIGAWLDRRSQRWKRGDGHVVFGLLGVALAVLPVAVLIVRAPDGVPARSLVWLVGVPIVVATVLARITLRRVVRSTRAAALAAVVVALPYVLALVLVFGDYLSEQGEQMRDDERGVTVEQGR